jgi:hypothetical protein
MFMETRLGAGFGDVRINTGHPATALCALLQARAFTLGSDIFFADGQYAPHTSMGKHLIAHELVHVLQQRTPIQPKRLSFVPIGNPLDDCESEADRLSEQVLRAHPANFNITPDTTGAIRRSIDLDSVRMTTSHKGARANAELQQWGDDQVLVLHLERNKAPIMKYRALDPSSVEASAIRIEGAVGVQGDISDIVRQNRFGFIQLILEQMCQAFYAGLAPTEGSIVMNFAESPPQFRLDSDAKKKPFTDTYAPTTRSVFGVNIVSTLMDDHPNQKLPTSVPNSMTNKTNYLIRVRKSIQLFTVFVVLDRSLTILPLGNVYWTAAWDATIRYNILKDGMDLHVTNTGGFVVGDMVKGAPTKLEDMITNPTDDQDEMYNKIVDAKQDWAYSSSVNNLTVQASKHWDARMLPGPQFIRGR